MEMKLEEIIKKYDIRYMNGNVCMEERCMKRAEKDGMLDTIKELKGETIAYFKNKEEREAQEAKEREEKIRAIEGLAEIESCRMAWSEWRAEFNDMMETGSSFMNTPRPSMEVKELRKKYPRADAYLTALAEANKTNYEMSDIGSKAVERIINGEDYTQVLSDMKKDMKEFLDRHIWD